MRTCSMSNILISVPSAETEDEEIEEMRSRRRRRLVRWA
jgi:hypothetical protein